MLLIGPYRLFKILYFGINFFLFRWVSDKLNLCSMQCCTRIKSVNYLQARVSDAHSCLIILRVMRDVCRRVPGWELVSDWVCIA